MKIASVSEMRGLDKAAIEKYSIREELLMENAGEAAYFVLSNEIGIKDKTFILFCGLGNNGGDGFVIARKIHSNKGLVKVYIIGDKSRFRGAAKMNLEIISGLPIEIKQGRGE